MRRNLALLGFSLLVAVIAAELALRWLRPDLRPLQAPGERSWKTLIHRPSDVPGLAYELVPGSETTAWGVPVRVNRYGLRDDEPRPDAPGLTRIVALGDSFTFGFGVPGTAAYPNVLERMLNRRAGRRRFEVLNFGVTGYSTWDEALVLEHKALVWDPRLVVLGYVLNDPEIDPTQPLQEVFARTGAWRRSSIVRLIARWRRARDLRRLGGGDYFRYLHAPGERKWRSVVAAFERMGSLARERDLPLLLVIFPSPKDDAWEPYPYLDLHRQVAEAARAAGFAVVDLYRPFSRHEPREVTLSPGDHHPNVPGHRVAARAIYRWIAGGSDSAGVRSLIATGPEASASVSFKR